MIMLISNNSNEEGVLKKSEFDIHKKRRYFGSRSQISSTKFVIKLILYI